MTRQKNMCTSGTLVLVLLALCPLVYSRPQQDTSAVVSSNENVQTNLTRYKFRNKTNLSLIVSPVVNNFVNNSYIRIDDIMKHQKYIFDQNGNKSNIFNVNTLEFSRSRSRKSRLLQSNSEIIPYQTENYTNTSSRSFSPNKGFHLVESHKVKNDNIFPIKNKPTIRKVITKWKDQTKYNDMDFSQDKNYSEEVATNINSEDLKDYSSRESIDNESLKLSKDNHPKLKKKIIYKARPHYIDETQSYPNNIQVIDNYPYAQTRPTYMYSTPTPTPIITNVGYPPPWPQQNYQIVNQMATTRRPLRVTKPSQGHYNYHNSMNNNYPQYGGSNFEVSTFQPTSAYTDRIIIRPEEYSASPDDCPTIYLTLNNTFQGQAKEACPDLNIAVNTNVVNKNVVVESEEETDGTFADAFGIPLMDDSESGDNNNDYSDSDENQEETESASIEGSALTNYNAANTLAQGSAEQGNYGSPSSALSTIVSPERPSDNDDDVFSFSSIIDFFKPALGAFQWLAAINPLSFGLISFILTPIAILFAGTSGLAALFAPLALSYAREAPKLMSMNRPPWDWDNIQESWQINSYADRGWKPILHKTSRLYKEKEDNSIKTTLFHKVKEWMRIFTQKLRSDKNSERNRRSKRRKRETWNMAIN